MTQTQTQTESQIETETHTYEDRQTDTGRQPNRWIDRQTGTQKDG